MKQRVLILSYSNDEHLDLVNPHLGNRAVTLHTDHPYRYAFNSQDRSGFISQNEWRCEFSEISAIWNRRPFMRLGAEALPERFSRLETRTTLLDTLAEAVPSALWVNFPNAVRAAHDKLRVLRLAKDNELLCPDWIVANDPMTISLFFGEKRQVAVLKPITTQSEVFAEVPALMYARLVDLDTLMKFISRGPITPLFIQQHINKIADWRVTVIDGFFSVVRMTGTPDGTLDFRRCYSKLSYQRRKLPDHIEKGIYKLLACLGLRYAAIDFVEEKETENLYFLEVNAGGQFGWLEEHAGQGGVSNFSRILADRLLLLS